MSTAPLNISCAKTFDEIIGVGDVVFSGNLIDGIVEHVVFARLTNGVLIVGQWNKALPPPKLSVCDAAYYATIEELLDNVGQGNVDWLKDRLEYAERAIDALATSGDLRYLVDQDDVVDED